MAPIKNELTDYVSISYHDDIDQFKVEPNTSSIEEIVCNICHTYFINEISLEHHLEDCYWRVCGVCEKTFTSSDTFYEHTRTHETPITYKKVILKQRRKLEYHKCRFCKMSYKFPAELRYHVMTHTTVKRYLCLYCGKNFSPSHRSKCERTQSRHSHTHVNKATSNKVRDSLKTEKGYGCAVCKKSYRWRKAFMIHKCIRTSYKCFHCNTCFSSRTNLIIHARTHIGEIICQFPDSRKESTLTMQKRIHAGEKLYKCSYCSKRCTKLSNLKIHERIHTGEKPYECSYCDKSFAQRGTLTDHERIHTGEKPYECSQCSKRFISKRSLQSHERVHTGEKKYECSHCSKRFTHAGTLKSHENTHTDKKSFECLFCSKRFNRQSLLTTHERTHTGEKPFECSNCKKRFASKVTLNNHERIHTGEKPYECSYCNKRFTQRGTLNKHEFTHTGEKPFKCSHCSKSFTRQYGLTMHERMHTGENPYQCSYCSKRFTQRGILITHERSHIGKKIYKCPHCNKCFTTQFGLTMHERTHTFCL